MEETCCDMAQGYLKSYENEGKWLKNGTDKQEKKNQIVWMKYERNE